MFLGYLGIRMGNETRRGTMIKRCPFCWSEDVKRVASRNGDGRSGHIKECRECEKWYWEENDEDAGSLFTHCDTPLLRPSRCYPEVLEVIQSGGSGFPRRRWAEFNHLCAGCPYGHYISRPEARRQEPAEKPV
jgi:hypothetical protein